VKRCSACLTEKPLSEFYKRPDRASYSVRSKCKSCEYLMNRQWQIKNRDYVNRKMRESYRRNPERSINYSRKWRVKNPEKRRAQGRREMIARKQHVDRRILLILRQRINKALRGNWKSGRTVALLGCSIQSFKIYLESRFDVGMSWSNYGRGGWHIDHIIPCALFDLSRSEHQKRCFHFSNLQPLWESENCKKGDKLSEECFKKAWKIINGTEYKES
jgi:hypothetical protein